MLDVLPAVVKEEKERSAWLVLARWPLVRAMAERRPLMLLLLLLLLLLAVPRTPRTRRRAYLSDIGWGLGELNGYVGVDVGGWVLSLKEPGGWATDDGGNR